jgi:CheY-like chemotaxis protein
VKKIEKILLIEDDSITNYLNEKIILDLDIAQEIVATINGRDALIYLQETDVFPALIVLDISMPVLDGFNFLEEFKRLKFHKKKTTIVILTSSAELDDMIRLKYLGKYGYYNKPLTSQKMQHIYEEYFNEDETGKMA